MDVIVLLGAPGAGKGTAATRLVARLSARHVSSGDLLRDAVRRDTPAGREADGFMKRGDLVPDALVGRIIADLLAAGDAGQRYLLDGFPRTEAQAEMLDRVVGEQGGHLRGVVLLDVAEEVLVDRLAGRRVCPQCAANFHVRTLPPRKPGVCDACGATLVTRADDNQDTVRTRLAVFHERTASLIAWYERRGQLRRVDGTGGADEVAERIMRALA